MAEDGRTGDADRPGRGEDGGSIANAAVVVHQATPLKGGAEAEAGVDIIINHAPTDGPAEGAHADDLEPMDDGFPAFEHDEVAALMAEEEKDLADQELSFALIARRNLPEDFLRETDAAGIAAAVSKLTTVRLDRCRLAGIGGGDGPIGRGDPLLVANAMRHVTSLYLQANRLTSTRGISVDTTPALRFLALQGNKLRDLEGVETLPTLMFLDVSDNAELAHLDELVCAVPLSVRFLRCAGCGASRAGAGTEYRQALVASLPRLKSLDDADVSRAERRAAREAFGEDPDDTDDDEDDDDDDEEEEEAHGEEEVRNPSDGLAAEAAAAASKALAASYRPRSPSASASLAAVEMDRGRLKSVVPTLTDPTLDHAVAFEALTVDAKSEVRRAKDRAMARASARLDEARDEEIDVDARVRRERAIHGASMREAEAMLPFHARFEAESATGRPGTGRSVSSRPGTGTSGGGWRGRPISGMSSDGSGGGEVSRPGSVLGGTAAIDVESGG